MTELRDGRYVLLRKLGEGSQGETWEAIDHGTAPRRTGSLSDQWNRYVAKSGAKPVPSKGERIVAIKAFRLSNAKVWKDVELAEREARTLASLDHGKLPRYVEHFEEEGALYLVMEKIEGESLAAVRKSGRTLAPGEVVRFLEDAADALGYLHARAPAIVHRDIKPGNVIRRSNGSFAVVDFGAVRDRLKPEGGSTVVGTFGYMAPEQFQGRASPKSDVYGVGATALTMLTGCEPEDLPHEGLGIDVARAVPDGTPPALVAALEAMLEPDPDRRVSSVKEALALLGEDAPRRRKKPRESKKNREQRRREAKLKRAQRGPEDDERDETPPPQLQPVGRFFAQLGLAIALIAVRVSCLLASLVLMLLSLVFGAKLRAAAKACNRASGRAAAAIGRASARISGRAPPPRLRIRTDLDRARSVTEPEAQRIAIDDAESGGEDADAWLEEKIATETRRYEEEERKRARMRTHARPPPKGKHWGR